MKPTDPHPAAPFAVERIFDLSAPALHAWSERHRRDIETIEAALLGGQPRTGFLSGLTEAALRECLRRMLRRVRSQAELESFLERHRDFEGYLPPRRAA